MADTVAGDAAIEADAVSVAQAVDTQQRADAVATESYTVASSSSYAAAMQGFDQANPSPWADQYAAQAAG